jgi:hypothetical protein
MVIEDRRRKTRRIKKINIRLRETMEEWKRRDIVKERSSRTNVDG